MVHIINDLLHTHRSWKHISMSELTELYISMMIKTLGLSFIGIFIPVYLYQLGYSVPDIALFFVFLYGYRLLLADYTSARIVGYIGPKKTMIISHIYLVVSMALLLALEYSDINLYLIALINGTAYSLFFVAYHVEFSKIQTASKAGKELSIMFQLGKIAGAIGPVLGGVIAQFYGVGNVIIVAIALVLLSAVPLLMSPEPVRKYQHVTYKGFPWRSARRNIAINFFGSFDQMSTLFFWPLFVSLFVFTENVYLGVGALTSMGLVASFFAAKAYGKLIDSKKTVALISAGSVGSAFANLARIFAFSPVSATFVNLLGDPVGIAYRMPYSKIVYDEASSYEGYRNAYIAALLNAANLARALAWAILWALCSMVSDKVALQVSFAIAGLAVLALTATRERP